MAVWREGIGWVRPAEAAQCLLFELERILIAIDTGDLPAVCDDGDWLIP